VTIACNCCISQRAYLCTGSHDWSCPTFDLIVRPIEIKQAAWIAACSTVGPGVAVGDGAVLGLGSVAALDLEPWTIYMGAPVEPVRKREGQVSVKGGILSRADEHEPDICKKYLMTKGIAAIRNGSRGAAARVDPNEREAHTRGCGYGRY
jgi:hypothetical protein